jgi:predicted DNA-binding protein with PD1-like motif
MRSKTIESAAAPTYVLVLDPGDEAVARISSFARDQHLSAAQVTAIGAFERATVGWFDRDARQYRPIEVNQQCEVLSLVGDIAVGSDGPTPHLHAVLGLPDGSTRGGHLLSGGVWPTLEVIIRDTPAQPGITLGDPCVSIAWGVAVFHEATRVGLWLAPAAQGGAAMAAGAIILARSPVTTGARRRAKRGSRRRPVRPGPPNAPPAPGPTRGLRKALVPEPGCPCRDLRCPAPPLVRHRQAGRPVPGLRDLPHDLRQPHQPE